METTTKVYLFDHTARTKTGGFPVYIGYEDNQGNPVHITELNPVRSQQIINHSPNGFNWGYSGSGPGQCALAILLEVTKDKEVALRWYNHFTKEVIAHIPTDQKIQILETKISEWIESKQTYGDRDV